MTERLFVVGGDAAGMSAAAQARRRRDAKELEIVAFERGEYTSYSACGLPFFVADEVPEVDDLIARTPEEHRANGIDVQLRHEVVAIDLSARAVTVRDLDTERERVESFDQLVIATGSSPRRPDVPGVDAEGIYGIQTIADGIELRRAVDARPQQHAVVVGGGYIGLEMADAMRKRGFDVTVLEGDEQPMATLDDDMGALVADAMRGIGISVKTETRVTAFDVDDAGRVRGVVTGGETYPADIVVLGTGVTPNVQLADAAGIAIGPAGGITTDARMETSSPGVWAAGDCVQSRHRITGREMVIALGSHANKQGRIVGINATGGNVEFPGVLGTAVTKVCEYEIGRTGLSEGEARAAGFDYVTATIEATTRAGYFPGAQTITVKVVAERGSGRLLGGQIVGREGAAKRIDVLAIAIWNAMTVDEVMYLDLAYAPPFGGVWDPVLVAARRAAALV